MLKVLPMCVPAAHPGPLPGERVKHRPTPRALPGHTIRRLIGDDPPSPWGEGRGEGKLAAHGPTGFSGGDACKVQCPLPLSFRVVCSRMNLLLLQAFVFPL